MRRGLPCARVARAVPSQCAAQPPRAVDMPGRGTRLATRARRGRGRRRRHASTTPPPSACAPLQADRFGRDFLRLAGAPPTPPLVVALAAGVAALKTPFCSLPEHQAPRCSRDVAEISPFCSLPEQQAPSRLGLRRALDTYMTCPRLVPQAPSCPVCCGPIRGRVPQPHIHNRSNNNNNMPQPPHL